LIFENQESIVLILRILVVFRGPHDRYEKTDSWLDLPVISMPPTRWPKLNPIGTKYSFDEEREHAKNKLRAALRICLYNDYHSVAIGDFGLGNNYRNPPQELAELWREVFLHDPDIKGQFEFVAFIFEDANQSTSQCIMDDIAKKTKVNGSKYTSVKGKTKSSGSKSSHSSSSASKSKSKTTTPREGSMAYVPTDYEIYNQVFDQMEIHKYLTQNSHGFGAV
jgi:hypothetical protein